MGEYIYGEQVKTYVERRESIQAARWTGNREQAHEIAALWPDSTGFSVSDTTLTIWTSVEKDGVPARSVCILRGDFIEVERGRATKVHCYIDFGKKWQGA